LCVRRCDRPRRMPQPSPGFQSCADAFYFDCPFADVFEYASVAARLASPRSSLTQMTRDE
jgi:hypothetical protein